MTASGTGEIKVNRAPVLTLWAAVIAERLGYDPDAAITLGRVVAGSSARVKARAIGLEEDKHEGGRKERMRARRRGAPSTGRSRPRRFACWVATFLWRPVRMA